MPLWTSKPSGVRLSEYDEALLADRSLVHPAFDADFLDEEGEGGGASARAGRLNTLWAVGAYAAAVVAYAIWQYIEFWRWQGRVSNDLEFRIKATAQAGLLAGALPLEGWLRRRHRARQRRGYLQFYWQTRALLPIPVQVAGVATAAVLVLALWRNQLLARVDPLDKLAAVATLQAAAIGAWAVVYWRRVARAAAQAEPDAAALLQHELGANLRGREVEGVVEAQGEVVRLLAGQRDALARELLRLQARLDRRAAAAVGAGGDRESAADDAAHLLSAREREVRALAAELAAAQQQAGAAWRALDEREADVARLQASCAAHAEENGRLRATLAEWSHRNTKLEQRLAAARQRLTALEAASV